MNLSELGDTLVEPFRWALDFLHEQLNLTYGWSIVVLTVIVRTLLLPLVIKQYKSMREMQRVAPQIKELQQKYKGNRQKLNEEMMKFYRENEVNPFASCLPLLFQLPVFFALYWVLRGFSREDALDGTDPSFMWVIPDISERITEIGWGAAVVLGVYGLSQLISTELSATPQMPDIQKRLFRFLPIVIIASFFLFDYFIPAGLVLYWATTNLWTAGQQLVMRHRIGLHLSDSEVAAKAPGGKRSSRTPPKDRSAAADGGGGADAPEGTDDADPGAADGGEDAGATKAPEPTEAPEPAEVPEPATPEPAKARSGGGRGGGQAKRRQPKGKGSGGGNRPARKQPRKRR